MASYYGKRREFTVYGTFALAFREGRHCVDATCLEVEGVRIFVEQPEDGSAVLILQAADGQPLRVGGLASNTLSLHREKP